MLFSLSISFLSANSLRTRPSQPRASRHSRASACGPHGARTPASTSTAAQWARRVPSGCGRRQRGRPAHHSRPRSIRQTGGLRSRALGSVGSRREIKVGIVEQRQLDLLTETAKSASARLFAAPRKRTNGPTSWDVRFVPKPAVSNRSNAAPHSITSSARNMIEAGTTRPSDFAVCRLIISSNRVGGRTGQVGRLSPLETGWCRDTSPATRSGETRGPPEGSAPRATAYKTNTSGLTPPGAASGRCAPG
jgi:hypothetical protein